MKTFVAMSRTYLVLTVLTALGENAARFGATRFQRFVRWRFSLNVPSSRLGGSGVRQVNKPPILIRPLPGYRLVVRLCSSHSL